MIVKDQIAQKRCPKIGETDSHNRLLKKAFTPWKELGEYGENFCVYIREEAEHLPYYVIIIIIIIIIIIRSLNITLPPKKKLILVSDAGVAGLLCHSVQLCTWE